MSNLHEILDLMSIWNITSTDLRHPSLQYHDSHVCCLLYCTRNNLFFIKQSRSVIFNNDYVPLSELIEVQLSTIFTLLRRCQNWKLLIGLKTI